MKKTNFTCAGFGMTVKGLKKKMENGEVTFENSVQRGLSWDLERKSFLIDSILQGYPIPDMYAQRGENGVYDMLDGKQRSNAIVDFINGKYALTGMSENMEEYEGLTFDQLEEEDKDTILDRNISIKYLDGATKEEIRVEVCSKCHPFYTGSQKLLLEAGGRVEKFNKKYGRN